MAESKAVNVDLLERKELTNTQNSFDLNVTTYHPSSRKTYISTNCIFGLFILLTLIALLVVTVVIVSRPQHSCRDQENNVTLLGADELVGESLKTPALLWSSIRLPRTVFPVSYVISLTIDLEQFTFSGQTLINVKVKQTTDMIVLHAASLTIKPTDVSVVQTDSPNDNLLKELVEIDLNEIYVLLLTRHIQQGVNYQIIFKRYQGVLSDTLRGLYRSSYRQSDGSLKYLAASQLQSTDARRVFPCFDEPDMKSIFTVTLIHKKELMALSNMPIIKSKTLDKGWVEKEYQSTPVMSTYLLAFVVMEFHYREQTLPSGLQIRVWAQPDMSSQTSYALDFAAQVYQFFTGYFNTSEVVPKADHVAIPDFRAGAMENWGLVLYRETTLLHDESVSSMANKQWVSMVMAHEIAHTWFGNMVTMKWWDDLWLNEGFANTLMYFALDHIYHSWNVFDLQLVLNLFPVMVKDSYLTSHAVSTPIEHPDDITLFFDSISYDKGMAILRLLRGFLGWTNFQNGLRLFVSKFKFRNANIEELWSTLAEACGHRYDIKAVMDTWTRQMGFPVVTVKRQSENVFLLEQKRFLLNSDDENYNTTTSPYGYKWKVPFSYKIQGYQKVETEWLHMDSAEIKVPEGLWVIGNVDYTGFFRTNYEREMWVRISQQLHSNHLVFPAANRAGLINDAMNLARANQLGYDVALELATYLHNEQDYVPWRSFFDELHFIEAMLVTSDSYGAFQKYVHNLVAPQYRRVGTSDQGDLMDRYVRRAMLEVACRVAVPDALDWAKRTFYSWMRYGTRVPPDYAIVIYSVGIEHGGEEEWNYLWMKSRETRVASEVEIMQNALAYTQQEWLLWRYARWSLNSSVIRTQDVRNLFKYFAVTNHGRQMALKFLISNWQEINNKFGMDAFLLRDIISATTNYINTEYEYQQLKELYEKSPPTGVAGKTAESSLDLIRSNIKWMKQNHGKISEWLMSHHSTTTDVLYH